MLVRIKNAIISSLVGTFVLTIGMGPFSLVPFIMVVVSAYHGCYLPLIVFLTLVGPIAGLWGFCQNPLKPLDLGLEPLVKAWEKPGVHSNI